ncbi:amidophosphoribosyltransferase [Methylobacillus rhizosphaerae]|uniref:Amidophosphoribosyltransferase n=1 Tax=Methylobacillus rhizosphaerae TaxID=551994 RepID=A0A238YIZ9_9PROT|nr:amidophosphoribosyltransferase [Methylobacillus rhizosphaerae]SNR70614.1 amidophosphoribosyltransferase [Methylobacillus rhizosphaerae]
MCGIIGVVGKNPVNQLLYDGLLVLQHRGQDAAGIVTCDGNTFFMHKNNGLVQDVFQTRHMRSLIGNAGIAHVRYPTAGSSSAAEAQPFYVNSPFGIVLGHNGNLTNSAQLKQEMFRQDLRHINTNSDSEVLLNVLAHEIETSSHSAVLTADMVFEAVAAVHKRCRGAYAVVAMIANFGLLAFRDPNGIRPLVIGKNETEQGTEYIVASESVALDVLGFTLVRDVEPGEAVFIDMEGNFFSRQCAEAPKLAPCIFEYVYLARPDSVIDNVSVYQTRLHMGESLADKIAREWKDLKIDVVIPIPDTSRPSALELANKLKLTYREGFIKNRYIGRTFIMPGQALRKKSVRQKLNPIGMEFQGKNVLLVDDSIVRGTTSKQIVQMARDAGASKVFFASAAPPVRFPNVYGIDMPSRDELLATGRTDQEICAEIGADALIYQDLDALITSVQKSNPGIEVFDCSCFDGNYITGDIDEEYLNRTESARGDGAQQARPANSITQLDLNLVASREEELV